MLVVLATLIERTSSQDKNCNTNTTMLSSFLISQSNPTPKTKPKQIRDNKQQMTSSVKHLFSNVHTTSTSRS